MRNAIKIFFLAQLFFTLHLFASPTQDGGHFSLLGTIKGNAPKHIILSYLDSAKVKHQDTAIVKFGRFKFQGSLSGPTLAYLIGETTSRSLDDPNRMIIFLEPKAMEMELVVNDFESSKVRGSKTHEDFQLLNALRHPLRGEQNILRNTLDSLKKLLAANGSSEALQYQLKKAGDRWPVIYHSVKMIENKFVMDNRNSIVSAFLMPGLINAKIMSLDTAELISERFPRSIKNSDVGRELQIAITAKRAAIVDRPAPKVEGRDIAGKALSSEDFIGKKYILLDFWASWCLPCHEQAPYLNAFYEKYRQAGFEIIGISADQDRMAWERAIKKHKVGRWRNMLLSDEVAKESGKKLSDRFGIGGYPVLFLIDKSGKIIYRKDGYGGSEEMKRLDDLIRSSVGL